MKIKIIQISSFTRTVDGLLKKRHLLQEDFDAFQKDLIERPDLGDIIVGTSGVRKARLKSSSTGKSGGFRVCYYLLTARNHLFLLLIYPKNVQENLSIVEKKTLKELVSILKETNYEK